MISFNNEKNELTIDAESWMNHSKHHAEGKKPGTIKDIHNDAIYMMVRNRCDQAIAEDTTTVVTSVVMVSQFTE